MNQYYRKTLFFFLLMVCGIPLFSIARAQEENYRIAYTDVFGQLRRPAIEFAHDDHADALDAQGCGACHHAPDEKTGRLVYIEDEEIACGECHGHEKEDDSPALREAFHGSCTACHRKMLKSQDDFSGPTTCGECHVPAKDPIQK